MTNDTLKKQAATKALEFLQDKAVIGIGTGSTTNFFIDLLAGSKAQIEMTVASSEQSAARLKQHGIPVCELTCVDAIDLYVDGADEFNHFKQLIKGGGGALTREKILACNAKEFICIVDESKRSKYLGQHFYVPVEVIPMARSYVARQIVKLGGDPVYREAFVTDNGNIILDVHNMKIDEPEKLESQINNITGVVCNGIFAHRTADKILVASSKGVEVIA